MSGMGGLRRFFRILLSLLLSVMMYVVALLIKLLTPGTHPIRFKIVCRATSFWAYGIARIWGMKIKISGSPPPAPFFLVSNHISYTDIVVLCATCPAWFISKSEVADWPLIGPLTRIGPTIYINREQRRDVKRMNKLIADLIGNGGAVGFFPEGTTSDGCDLLPFKPSLFQPMVEAGLPVSTAAIAYQTPPGTPPPTEWVAWVGDTAFAPHAAYLLAQPGFTAHIRFAAETVTADDRKVLAATCHEKVKTLLSELKADIA